MHAGTHARKNSPKTECRSSGGGGTNVEVENKTHMEKQRTDEI